MTTPGTRIRNLRNANFYTQEHLADRLGVSKVAVQKYENGRISVKTDTLEKLGEIFGVSPAYIMGWDKFDENPQYDIDTIKDDLKIIEILNKRYGLIDNELYECLMTLNELGMKKVLLYADDLKHNQKYTTIGGNEHGSEKI